MTETITPADHITSTTAKRGSALIVYDECRLYDQHRQPVGIRWMARQVRKTAKRLHIPIHEIEMSALCCGTGQNEEAILSELRDSGESITKINCVDGSEGMLASVADKLSVHSCQTTTHQVDVLKDELPFERQHLISCIQAVQHFEDSQKVRDFSSLRRFYRRVREKLVRGGEFFQVISVPEQVLHSYWFYNLMSGMEGVTPSIDPAHHFAMEHPPLERALAGLEASNFKVREWKIIRRPHFQKTSYYGAPDIVMNEEFRHSSSIFWIMRRRELAERYDEIARQRLDDGSLFEHRSQVEKARKEIGISIAISAKAI